jgi:hypothetical protein
LTACSSETPRLNAIPAPLPVHEVKVPVLVKIPIGMTTPCETPPRRPIATDVDLLEAADAFKVWGACNAAKLKAIETAQPG